MGLMIQNTKSVKRDKFGIMLDILNISRTPIKRTHVLYKANINFYQLTRYIDLLTTVGMIEEVQSPFKGYRITEKGLQFIKMFEPANDGIKYEEKPAYQLLQLR